MSKVSRGGRTLKRLLEWHLNRDITDAEIAGALGLPAATFSRRKDADGYPSFEELDMIGVHFGANPRWLQVEFGYLDIEEINENGNLKQAPAEIYAVSTVRRKKRATKLSGLSINDGAPPLR